jgi:transmembrane sensor
MTSDNDKSQIAAAASWDVRLRSHACTDRDRAAFRAWCDDDTRHREAFDRLQLALGALRQAAEQPQLRALRERAEVMTRRSSVRRAFLRASIAAGLVTIVVAIARYYPTATSIGSNVIASSQQVAETHPGKQTYFTDIRERRIVALPDGSSATLNAATRLETVWLPHERRIRLLSGQVLFRVSKDPSRPFVVTVGDRTITALGTAFDVRLDVDKIQVTLLEGRIAVRGIGPAARQPTLELAPNEQLVAIEGQAPTVHVVNLVQSTAWADGQVYFTDKDLTAAVEEMNRYSSQEIIISDPNIARFRVNGMFRAGNQEGFVSALSSYYPIDAHRDNQGRIVLSPRPDDSEKR